MPMAGAAKDLAAEFGFEFANGFVLDTVSGGQASFSLKEKTLIESMITKGETQRKVWIKSFRLPARGSAYLLMLPRFWFSIRIPVNMLPDTGDVGIY
ncbi:MAG: hypothetical protein MZU84_00915 [Sphingobacterium sp.]|nr:hypothetical protein [Sphingobacterium sp.]